MNPATLDRAVAVLDDLHYEAVADPGGVPGNLAEQIRVLAPLLFAAAWDARKAAHLAAADFTTTAQPDEPLDEREELDRAAVLFGGIPEVSLRSLRPAM